MLRIGDDATVGNLHADQLHFPDGTLQTSASSNTPYNATNKLNATFVGDGTVSNIELGHLNSVTGNVQSQLDAKIEVSSGLGFTAGNVVVRNAANNGFAHTTPGFNANELGFVGNPLSGVGNTAVNLADTSKIGHNDIIGVNGAAIAGNASKVITTDGAGNLSWTNITPSVVFSGSSVHPTIYSTASQFPNFKLFGLTDIISQPSSVFVGGTSSASPALFTAPATGNYVLLIDFGMYAPSAAIVDVDMRVEVSTNSGTSWSDKRVSRVTKTGPLGNNDLDSERMASMNFVTNLAQGTQVRVKLTMICSGSTVIKTQNVGVGSTSSFSGYSLF